MLLIKTYLAPSKIQGLGLFAAEEISKGEITWKFVPNFDVSLSIDEINKLPLLAQIFIKKYGYLSIMTNKYVLCNDDARFTNHSSKPNILSIKTKGEIEPVGIAGRDIKRDEELTTDYRIFDKNDAVSEAEYLKS